MAEGRAPVLRKHDRKAGFSRTALLFRRGAFLAARGSPPFDRALTNNDGAPMVSSQICHVCRRRGTKCNSARETDYLGSALFARARVGAACMSSLKESPLWRGFL